MTDQQSNGRTLHDALKIDTQQSCRKIPLAVNKACVNDKTKTTDKRTAGK
jgi:hypothetical protein